MPYQKYQGPSIVVRLLSKIMLLFHGISKWQAFPLEINPIFSILFRQNEAKVHLNLNLVC